MTNAFACMMHMLTQFTRPESGLSDYFELTAWDYQPGRLTARSDFTEAVCTQSQTHSTSARMTLKNARYDNRSG